MNYTVMDLEVLEVLSVLRSHPFLTSSLVLLFTTPLFHLVLFFSPLLISTALCVITLVNIGPQIEKIREERERQFKLLGLTLTGVENERSPDRYLILRRGRQRPPRGRGRGERWTNWVRGMEIRGRSLWLSQGSQLMSDIAEENLKADFGGNARGLQMMEEDFVPSGALFLARAEDDLVSKSNFQTIMQPFCDSLGKNNLQTIMQPFCDSSVSQNREGFIGRATRNIMSVEMQRGVVTSSQRKFQSKAVTITEEDVPSCENNSLAIYDLVMARAKRIGVFQPVGQCEELGDQYANLKIQKTEIFYPNLPPSSSYKQDEPNTEYHMIATIAAEPELSKTLELNVQKRYEKQAEPVSIEESYNRDEHQSLVCQETSEEKAPFSLCGCFKMRRRFCFLKASREIKSKQKDEKAYV